MATAHPTVSTSRTLVLPELRLAAAQVAALVSDGARALARPAGWAWWQTLALGMWLAGTVGDAYTTLAMMGTGMFEEANGVAAAGMGVLGPGGYTAAASALCVVLAVTNVGRPRGFYAKVVVVGLTLAAVLKVYTAGSNLLLWISA